MKTQSQSVMELRQLTGLCHHACRVALEKCNWDFGMARIYAENFGNAVARFKLVDGERVPRGYDDWFFKTYGKGI